MRNLTIAEIVDFAVWAERRTSSIAMIVGCALIKVYIPTITARVENISRTVQCVRSIFSAHEVRRMRCRAATQFTGSASDSWLRTTQGVQFARRLPKRETE